MAGWSCLCELSLVLPSWLPHAWPLAATRHEDDQRRGRGLVLGGSWTQAIPMYWLQAAVDLQPEEQARSLIRKYQGGCRCVLQGT
ncbi:hypothetical protein DAEQUDRAFT_733882 [Daedalea quercina L-15889]|uniref:Secreted protein n=1 Tax=Daedalea quercina L-15889 TaxID=1314783 RepID=A0A165KNZ9_9APHY|nr:hypothetical protein DAEQUDRAFT_733882 [Daedalea quercina L-15889]